jgi:hypothetical protein
MLLPFLNEHTLWPQAQAACSAVQFLLVEALEGQSLARYLIQIQVSSSYKLFAVTANDSLR